MQPTPLLLPGSEVSYSYPERALDFDERYIDGLRNRNPEVEAHFVAHFQTPIRAQARQYLWVPNLSEDACQETLMRVVRHLREGKPLNNTLPAFVHGVSRNVIHEINRREHRYQSLPEDWDLPDLEPNPYELLRTKLVLRILNRLRRKDRALLIAALQCMDKEEMCRQFGATPNYLRVLTKRARDAFRQELAKLPASLGQAKGEGAD